MDIQRAVRSIGALCGNLGVKAISHEKAHLSQDPNDHKQVGGSERKGQVGRRHNVNTPEEGGTGGKQRLWPEVSQGGSDWRQVGRRVWGNF